MTSRGGAAGPRRSPARAAVFGVALGVAVAAGTLVLLEFLAGFLVVRYEDQPMLTLDDETKQRNIRWLDLNPAPLVSDADFVWRNRAGARELRQVNPRPFGKQPTWTIANSSQGYRGREISPWRTPQGTLRVLCVGDSVTFGFNVDQAHSYPHQLEEELRRRHPGRSIEVVNGGVPGWSWLQGLRYLEVEGLTLEPDLVVIGHGTNDRAAGATRTDAEDLRRAETAAARAALRLAVFVGESNLFRAISRVMPEKPPVAEASPACREQQASEGACHRVSLGEIENAVAGVGRLLSGAGVGLLVVNTDFTRTEAAGAVRAAVAAGGLAFVDLVGELDRRRREEEDARARARGLRVAGPIEGGEGGADVKTLRLRALVPDPAEAYRAAGHDYAGSLWSFDEALRDDGSGGDEQAGDGVFSVDVAVPRQVTEVEYEFRQDGASDVPEFLPLPPIPSTLGRRLEDASAGRVAPVEIFGESLFMAERVHPNANGQRAVAEAVAGAIEASREFRAFAEGGR